MTPLRGSWERKPAESGGSYLLLLLYNKLSKLKALVQGLKALVQVLEALLQGAQRACLFPILCCDCSSTFSPCDWLTRWVGRVLTQCSFQACTLVPLYQLYPGKLTGFTGTTDWTYCSANYNNVSSIQSFAFEGYNSSEGNKTEEGIYWFLFYCGLQLFRKLMLCRKPLVDGYLVVVVVWLPSSSVSSRVVWHRSPAQEVCYCASGVT